MDGPLSYLLITSIAIAGIVVSAFAAEAATGPVSMSKSRGEISCDFRKPQTSGTGSQLVSRAQG